MSATAVVQEETVEITVVCESCFRVTTKECSPDEAKKVPFVKCRWCGTFVRYKK